jgi:hypothetical protein
VPLPPTGRAVAAPSLGQQGSASAPPPHAMPAPPPARPVEVDPSTTAKPVDKYPPRGGPVPR